MKKLYLFLIIIAFNYSYSQATKQDKRVCASTVYGYFTGIEAILESVYENKPNFRTEVNQLNLLLTTNFGESKVNAIKYLDKMGLLKDVQNPKMDSLKKVIQTNIIYNSNEETKTYLDELKSNLKGNIPSPLLENALSFQYENMPSKEFSNGFTYTFNSRGHKKSKNTELILTIPKSWSAQEGKQPNIIQLFTSDCGNGAYTISIMTQEMPLKSEEFSKLKFKEIDNIYRDKIFTPEYARKLIDDNFISFKPMNIAGRAGFLVVFEKTSEKLGMKFKIRNSVYVVHDTNHLHFINCGIGTGNIEENLEEKSMRVNPLFFMIANSAVVPKKDSDVISLQGNAYQKIVDVKIVDKNYNFILDTGASVSLIGKNVINDLLENGIITKHNFLGKDYTQTADGKKHLVEFWNLPSIIVGGKKINDVNFAVMNGNIEPLLGMNILNKLNIWKIDLENYKIHLNN
jgi:hypothetical protein